MGPKTKTNKEKKKLKTRPFTGNVVYQISRESLLFHLIKK